MPEEPDRPLAFLPAERTESYLEGPSVAIVRTREEFASCLNAPAPGVEWLQVEGLLGDPEAWALAAQGTVPIPLDVILDDPAVEFSSLYRLVDPSLARSVRITVPALPGLMKAVRLAASLKLPVRILPGQLDESGLAELMEVVQFYLHDPMVDTPIEFFHSLLASFRGTATGTLWSFLEQDPAGFLHPPESAPGRESPDFVAEHIASLLESGAECAECPWQQVCSGYFKLPDPSYDCSGVKTVFSSLQSAAQELTRALADLKEPPGP